MTNVYRISVTLKEEIQGAVLQLALDKVLERFDTFRVRMRKGIFWYYFETNTKPAPTVYRENDYPCRYILRCDRREKICCIIQFFPFYCMISSFFGCFLFCFNLFLFLLFFQNVMFLAFN